VLSALRYVLRDPLCRCEARRYWTWRRYAWCGGFMAAWAGGITLWAGLAWGRWSAYPQPVEDLLVAVAAFWLLTLPLDLVAGTAGALSIAPERESGQLEQMILTPVEPGRFCRARLAARLKGVLALWALTGPLLAGCAVFAWKCWLVSDDQVAWFAAAWAVMYLMCPAMLAVGTATGMRYSATARSTALAAARTYPVVLLVLPAAMLWGIFTVSTIVAGCAAGMIVMFLGESLTLVALVPLTAGLVLLPTAFAVMSVRKSLGEACAAMEKVFYSPGEA